MNEAASLARKIIAFATSSGFAKRFAGEACAIVNDTSSMVFPVFRALFSIISCSLPVAVAPGNTLFTVIPKPPSSLAIVLLQFATAPRIVLLTPKPSRGCFTEVEITFIIRP